MSLPTQREAEAFLTPLRSRSTIFLVALTSFLARTRPQTIISKVYARNRAIQNGRRGARSLDRLGDLGVAVKFEASELTFTCKNGSGWRGEGTFSVRVTP